MARASPAARLWIVPSDSVVGRPGGGIDAIPASPGPEDPDDPRDPPLPGADRRDTPLDRGLALVASDEEYLARTRRGDLSPRRHASNRPTIGRRVSPSTMRKTSPSGLRLASRLDQPVSVSAAAFMKTTRPVASVAITASTMLAKTLSNQTRRPGSSPPALRRASPTMRTMSETAP